eukprot:8128407-Heterocapsa_arctica.AAC.1
MKDTTGMQGTGAIMDSQAPKTEPPIRPKANSHLAEFGHRLMSTTLDAWWKIWKGKGTKVNPIIGELGRIARRAEPAVVSEDLKSWAAERGVDADIMSPKDARTLLTAVHVEASSMRGHLLTGASNGPSANRPVLHSKYRLG